MANSYRWALQLIERCYQAAENDNRWPEILKDFRESINCVGATFFCTDHNLKPIGKFLTDNISPESVIAYQAHYHSVDIRMQRAIPGALNKVVSDLDLVDENVVNDHEFYQDFLRPNGLRYVVSAVMDLEDGAFAFCSAHRGLNQAHAESEDLKTVELILPHIRRSLQLQRRLSPATSAGNAALDILDRLSQAVFFIDRNGRIVWQNERAGRLLDQRDGFVLGDGGLRALSLSTNTELQRLTSSAVQAIERPKERPGGMMVISRPSLKRSYQVLIAPLPKVPEMFSEAAVFNDRPHAVIFVVDPEDEPAPSTEVLSTLYSLTPAEARLAKALASGSPLKVYAERYHLSIHYVRWLLKQIEGKTDTRRIGDLTRLLVRQNGLFGDMLQNDKENGKK